MYILLALLIIIIICIYYYYFFYKAHFTNYNEMYTKINNLVTNNPKFNYSEYKNKTGSNILSFNKVKEMIKNNQFSLNNISSITF